MSKPFDAIIITSDEPYSATWHTQLIYTDYLPRLTEVIFINPPQQWKFSNLFKLKLQQVKVNEHLTLINYNNLLPVSIGFFHSVNEWHMQFCISKRLKKENAESILIWHFDSFRNAFNAPHFAKKFTIKRIYHVIDPFLYNPLDRLLSKLADLIVITSPKNNIHYQGYQEKIMNVPQCIDLEVSEKLLAQKSALSAKVPANFVVLLGTISDDIDFEWLDGLTNHTDLNIVVIGKCVVSHTNKPALEDLLKRKNVYYLGEMPPSEFYPVIKKAHAGLIVYNNQRRRGIFSPLKAINYLAAGLPILTNSDCEIAGLENTCIYTVNSQDEFISKVNDAFKGILPFQVNEANRYLQSVSLKQAVDRILSKI